MAEEQAERAARLLGKRYVTDFRVVAVGNSGDGGELEAVLLMHGERYRLSVDELETIIERGLVAEVPLIGGVT